MNTKTTCIHCGTAITSITHRLNDGFCMVCCDSFPRLTGTPTLLAEVTEAEVDAELSILGNATSATLHRWLRIKSRREPGDRLVRFRSDLQQSFLRFCDGVVWQREGAALSGIVLRTVLLVNEGEWIGEQVRFATASEIAANPAVQDAAQPRDTVFHYLNTRDPESIAEDGQEGLVLVRKRQCVLRVRIERQLRARTERRDVAQLELGLVVRAAGN